MPFTYNSTDIPVRGDLGDAYRTYWRQLAAPGSWWTGAQRVAIAAASRDAIACALCTTRKAALSPYGTAGSHDGASTLPQVAVDAVHRVVTDQSRITRGFVANNVDSGLSKGAYVELVGIVVAVLSIDEFHRALGLPLESLPQPEPGVPSEYQPEHLSEDIGFVPTIAIDGTHGAESDLWPPGRGFNVVRALSLVPNAVREWLGLSGAQYIPIASMSSFDKPAGRALDRMQIELVAGRVSSVNECFY